jgi:hypothetical protein
MGRPRKDPRKGLSWQIIATVLLMLALPFLLMVSMTASSRFLPNFPGDILTDVNAQPDLGSQDGTGDGFFQSSRSLSERELLEAVHNFVFLTDDTGPTQPPIHDTSPGSQPVPQVPVGSPVLHCPHKCQKRNKHGVIKCRPHCH